MKSFLLTLCVICVCMLGCDKPADACLGWFSGGNCGGGVCHASAHASVARARVVVHSAPAVCTPVAAPVCTPVAAPVCEPVVAAPVCEPVVAAAATAETYGGHGYARASTRTRRTFFDGRFRNLLSPRSTVTRARAFSRSTSCCD